jgi:hypothetical protein
MCPFLEGNAPPLFRLSRHQRNPLDWKTPMLCKEKPFKCRVSRLYGAAQSNTVPLYLLPLCFLHLILWSFVPGLPLLVSILLFGGRRCLGFREREREREIFLQCFTSHFLKCTGEPRKVSRKGAHYSSWRHWKCNEVRASKIGHKPLTHSEALHSIRQ